MRYYEFRRNYADIYRVATIYNLRRAITILSQSQPPASVVT
jgi:hypothetical protein